MAAGIRAVASGWTLPNSSVDGVEPLGGVFDSLVESPSERAQAAGSVSEIDEAVAEEGHGDNPGAPSQDHKVLGKETHPQLFAHADDKNQREQ